MKSISIVIGMMALFSVTGCASFGNMAIGDRSNIDRIQEGLSTKSDVRAAIGEPLKITPLSDGELWEYYYAKGNINPIIFVPIVGYVAAGTGHGNYANIHNLSVLFDNRGVVRKVEAREKTISPALGHQAIPGQETLRSTSSSPPLDQPQTTPQPFSKQIATPPYQPKAIDTSPIEQKTPHTVGKKESYGYAPAEEPLQSKVLINPDTGAVMNNRPGDKQAGFVEIEKLPSVGIKLPKNDNAENGIIIEGVYPGSPAVKAGLKAGDKLVEKNGQPVKTLSDLRSQLKPKIGDIVEYKIIRNGRERVFSMKTVPFADIVEAK